MTVLGLTDAERARIQRVDRLVLDGAAGVAELVAMMSDASWTVRRAVVAALAALGDDAVPALCSSLRETRADEPSIAAAVDALSSSVGADVTAAVSALAGHAVPAVVADAAQILGRRRAGDAAPLLARLLDHPDDNVAVAAIEALGSIGGTQAVEALIGVLAQRSFFRTFPTLQVLARTADPRVVGPIASLLEDETYRFEAARALGRTGFAQAIRPLASLVGANDAQVRLVALALADLLARAEWTGALDHVVDTLRAVIGPSLGRFVAALRRADTAEQTAIAAVLGRIGDASAIPELARLLDDAAVRDVAIAAIQHVGRGHEDALIDALGSDDPGTRAAVLPVVRTVRAAEAVRLHLSDEDPELRAHACEALARIGDTTAVPDLFAALADPNPRVAYAATAAIHSLGAADTARRTIEAIHTGSNAVRRHALRIIAYMGFDEAFAAVRDAIADADTRVAELAVAALAALGDPRVDAMLSELASDPREHVRAATMRGAGQRGGELALRLLSEGLRDTAPWVRYYACRGLGVLGQPASTALVIDRLADEAPYVRIAAIEALGHLDTPEAWVALCAAVRSPDLDEQRAALASMTLRQADRALPVLLDRVRSDDIATQLIALNGLARMAAPAAIAALATAASHGAPEVRTAALSLLGDRDDDGAAIVVVELAIGDADHPAQATLSQPGEARVHAIARRLPAADDRTASILVGALARMRDEAATAALFDALALDNPVVRRAVASALVALGGDAGQTALARLGAQDPDAEVRRIARTMGLE